MSDDENKWERDDYGDEQNQHSGYEYDSNCSDYQKLSLKHEEDDDYQKSENQKFNEELSSEDEQSETGDSIDEGLIENRLRNQRFRVFQPPISLIPTPETITSQFMSKYELCSILGKRAQQISKNSPLYIEIDDKQVSKYDVIEIAEMELKAKKIPFIIRRMLPNGYYEDWKVSDLIIWGLK